MILAQLRKRKFRNIEDGTCNIKAQYRFIVARVTSPPLSGKKASKKAAVSTGKIHRTNLLPQAINPIKVSYKDNPEDNGFFDNSKEVEEDEDNESQEDITPRPSKYTATSSHSFTEALKKQRKSSTSRFQEEMRGRALNATTQEKIRKQIHSLYICHKPGCQNIHHICYKLLSTGNHYIISLNMQEQRAKQILLEIPSVSLEKPPKRWLAEFQSGEHEAPAKTTGKKAITTPIAPTHEAPPVAFNVMLPSQVALKPKVVI